MLIIHTGLRFYLRGLLCQKVGCGSVGFRLRVVLLVLIDALLVNVAFAVAFSLRFFEAGIPVKHYLSSVSLLLLATFMHLAAFYILKLYHRVWSYASTGELLAVIYAVSAGALGTVGASFFLRVPLPRSVIIMAWAFTIMLVGGSRFAWRLYVQGKKNHSSRRPARRALIVGAGDAGAMVARELTGNDRVNLKPVGFVDDDPGKRNMTLLGIPVLGRREDIPGIVRRRRVDEIIIAMPSVNGRALKDIVEICRNTEAELKILPGMYEIIGGRVSINRIRPVRVEDLLRREPVKVDLAAIASYLEGKVVLVTGAGGSIGSELCRQAAAFGPGRLVLLGHGENSIHKVWQELEDSFPALDVAVEIADVRDFPRMEYIFNRHRPAVVFHAAAHKHVPLMEMHPGEAVKTNVLGTRNAAEAAHRAGAGVFILISTDKAVNPSSVMGATKRLAELVVRRYSSRSNTVFTAVRFGNVLGSNGSVVPVFEQQIRRGGPVKITHPEMKRYFMTIPEAVSLVIQAGSMAGGGEVFVLDMGEPVRILDLARDMIRLSGYEPGKDIEIVFTGIRPGEKLFEELLTAEEGSTATRHKKIFIARPGLVDATALEKELAALEKLPPEADGERIMQALRRVIPGFTPGQQQAGIPRPGTAAGA